LDATPAVISREVFSPGKWLTLFGDITDTFSSRQVDSGHLPTGEGEPVVVIAVQGMIQSLAREGLRDFQICPLKEM
jgi:hypothetical protein